MKKIKFLVVISALFGLGACSEEKFNLWSDPETHLAFKHVRNDSVSTYTFVYESEEVKRDTVYLNIYTSGFVSDKDRVFELEQLDPRDSKYLRPVAGTHFVKFDDPEMSKYFVIKAGTAKAKVPIIMLRDASLAEAEYELRLKIKKNENFTYGVEVDLEKRLIFADVITRPNGWNTTFEKNFFGTYSKVKHRFMINVTHGVNIDEAFFKSIYGAGGDMNLLYYYMGYYKEELIKENDRRKANGLDVLREDPKEGQTIGDAISFK